MHLLRQQLTWVNRVRLSSRADVALGAEGLVEHGVDNGFLQFGPFPLPANFTRDRTMPAMFAEARIEAAPGLTLEASGRYDWPSGAKGRFSPEVRANYVIAATSSRLTLSWARGYKLPSFYAQGNPIVGDPALRPETAQNIEADLSQPLSSHALAKLALFATHYVDLIDFQPGAIPKLVNLSRVHVQGVEASLNIQIGVLTVSPHVSFTDAHNAQTGARLRDVPAWLGGGSLLWRFRPDATLNVDVSSVGSMVDNSVPTGDVSLSEHTRVDIAVTWKFKPELTLRAGIENVLGAHYEDVVGFPAPTAVARIGLTAGF